MRALPPTRDGWDGVTILEAMVALTILALTFTSLYALYGQGLGLLRATNQAAIAQNLLLARADRLRDLGWSILSGSSSTSVATVLSTTDSTTLYRITNFPKAVETISAYAYSPPSVPGSSATYLLTGSNSSAPVLTPASYSTGTNSCLQFVIHLQWTDSHSLVHSREITTVVNKSGTP